MKKLLLLIAVLCICSTAHADRVTELQTEAQGLQARLQQYNQITQNIQVRLIEIQGIVKELQRVPEMEEVPEEVKDERPN